MVAENLPSCLSIMTFFTSPEDALRAAAGSNKKTIVISGNVFEETNLDGDWFAREFKANMSDVKVYCYSVCPSGGEHWDGLIVKEQGTCATGDHASLIEFLRAGLK